MNLHPQFIIDASYLRRRVPVHLRPEAHVLAGHGALRHRGRRRRHAGRDARELPVLLRRRRSGAAASHDESSRSLRSRSASAPAWAWWQGKRVAMTAMPQMVALYNGMGGGAAAAIAAVELLRTSATTRLVPLVVTVIGALIGCDLAVRLADRVGEARRQDRQDLAHARPAGAERRGVRRDARGRRLHRVRRARPCGSAASSPRSSSAR